MEELTQSNTHVHLEVKQLNIKTITPTLRYWFNTTHNWVVTVDSFYIKLCVFAATNIFSSKNNLFFNICKLGTFTLFANFIYTSKSSLLNTFNHLADSVLFKIMTTFLTSFLNNLPQLQNKIAIKKNFVHLIQHYRWFNSLSLLPFVSKILTQHKSYRTFVKNQSVVPQHVSVNLPFLHRAFVFTHVCTTRFNTNNRFKINKQFSSNKTAIAQVKNVQKLSTRTRRLALALQQFSRTSANLLLNSTFQTRFSFTLAPGRSKRLNLLVDPSTQLLVPNARPITQSISLKMVELFISAQSHTSRKYKHNTFIKKYIYLRSCYSKTHSSFNLQSRFKQLD